MARRDIEFDAEGVTLRGWFYTADGASGPAPTIVMAHGFSAVKEMYLDKYAEAFAAAGLNALVFDNRNFGASDGEPRQEIDPWAQVRDYRHAITYASTLPRSTPTGSASGAAATPVGTCSSSAAIDRRVKAVVCQVPLVSGHDNFRALVRADFIDGFRHMFDADRARPLPRRGARRWCRWSTRTRWRRRRCPRRDSCDVVHRDRKTCAPPRGATR